jgi:hypothetical protein
VGLSMQRGPMSRSFCALSWKPASKATEHGEGVPKGTRSEAEGL